jgi:peptidoglycan/LPS O-acetylase OafA/YrhL
VFLLATLAANPSALAGVRLLARFGARSSFSVYVLHFPLIAFAAALAVGDDRLAPSLLNLIIVGAALTAALSLAIAFSALTEARTPAAQDRLRRLFRARPQVHAQSATLAQKQAQGT